MTSNFDVTNSAHQIQMTTICHWMKCPHENFQGTFVRSEIWGSVLPGFKVTMRFYFKLGLVLVTSDCGITAKCGVDKSVKTSACFRILRDYVLVQKRKVWRLRTFVVAQTVTIGKQRISPKSDLKKIIFTHSDCSRPGVTNLSMLRATSWCRFIRRALSLIHTSEIKFSSICFQLCYH